MNVDIKELLANRIINNEPKEVAPFFEDDAMVIDCRSCEYAPEPSSNECMSCMICKMTSIGSAERIILRTGKDIEISGKACNALRKIASLKRWSAPISNNNFRCRSCDMSRYSVINELWKDFPELHFDKAYETLTVKQPNVDCISCINATRKVVKQLESDIEDVRLQMTRRCFVREYRRTHAIQTS